MQISIRLANVGLVLFSVVFTSFLCTFLSVWSADVAIRNTKSARDDSLGMCFTVGDQSITALRNDLLRDKSTKVGLQLLSMFLPFRLSTMERTGGFMIPDTALASSWEYLNTKRISWWNNLVSLLPQGCTGVGVVTRDHQSLWYYEDVATLRRPPDAYHHIRVVWNNGTAYDGVTGVPAINRTARGSAIPFTGGNIDRWQMWGSCEYNAVVTNGTVLDPLCVMPWLDLRASSWRFSYVVGRGIENVRWSAPVWLEGYMGMLAVGVYPLVGPAQGVIMTGIDMARVSQFLKTIDLGTSKGRVFTNVRSSFMLPPGYNPLTGTSHGEASVLLSSRGPLPEYRPRDPANSTDEIIFKTVQAASSFHYGNKTLYEALLLFGDAWEYHITLENSTEPEAFFIQVTRVKDDYGIDWYCSIMLDRLYLMGAIDAAKLETQETLNESEKDVDSDLQTARIILFVSVVLGAVFLTGLAVLTVIAMTSPLIKLRDQMADVALMELEGIEIATSFLSEVSQMQASFLVMVQNLRELRNYMPLSVLQGDATTELEESEALEKSVMEKSANPSEESNANTDVIVVRQRNSLMSTNSRNSKEARLAVNARPASLRNRKVALASCNCRGFLSLGGVMQMQESHTAYIASILNHAQTSSGVPDTFNGDRVVVSWNTSRSCARYSQQAVTFCLALQDFTDLRVTCGACCGDAKIGTLGTTGMKKFSVLGGIAAFVFVLERLTLSLKHQLLVCPKLRDDVSGSFYSMAIERIHYPKYSNKPVPIFVIKGEKNVSEQEWMYQLAEGEENDPFATINKAFNMYSTGDYLKAQELLEGKADSEWLQEKITEAKQAEQVNPPVLTQMKLADV